MSHRRLKLIQLSSSFHDWAPAPVLLLTPLLTPPCCTRYCHHNYSDSDCLPFALMPAILWPERQLLFDLNLQFCLQWKSLKEFDDKMKNYVSLGLNNLVRCSIIPHLNWMSCIDFKLLRLKKTRQGLFVGYHPYS